MRRFVGFLPGAASGFLAFLAFPPAGWSPIAWIALVPLFAWIAKSGGRRVTLPFLGYGAVHFSLGLYWLSPVLTPIGPILLALLVWLLFVLPAGHALGFLHRRGWPLALSAPLVWVTFDWMRTWLFGGFPWLFLGHSQAWNTTLAQMADVVGAYGVTALIVFVNASLVAAWRARLASGNRAAAVRLAPAAGLLGIALVYGAVRLAAVETTPGPAVLLVQGNIAQYEKNEAWRGLSREEIRVEHLRRHLRLMERGLREHPETELVVWSESVFPFGVVDDPDPYRDRDRLWSRRGLDALARVAGGRPVIFGSLYLSKEGREMNSAFLLDSDGRLARRYDKALLVPGGEYVPGRSFMPGWFTERLGRWIEEHWFLPDLTAGDGPASIETAGTSWGMLICYEVIYPAYTRRTAGTGADVLLNLSNYGWYPGTTQPEQAEQITIFRALENRRPVVVSANTGITSVIDARGAVTRLVVDGQDKEIEGILPSRVPLTSGVAPYRSGGFVLPWIAAAAVLFGVVAGLIRKRKATGSRGPT